MKKQLILIFLILPSQFLFSQKKDISFTLEVNSIVYDSFSVNGVQTLPDSDYPWFDVTEISPVNDEYYKIVLVNRKTPSTYRVCHLKKGDKIEAGNSFGKDNYFCTVIKCEPNKITLKWNRDNSSVN